MSSSSSTSSSEIDLEANIIKPLSSVQTILVAPYTGAKETSNASDSPETTKTAFAKSFSFDTIAPGETSKTIIFYLWVPNARAIGNIKMGLLNTGGIPFTTSSFGITTSINLYENISPQSYFQGINATSSASNENNISIPNKDVNTSEYVYLNITPPNTFDFQVGIIQYKWFFDYDGLDTSTITTTTLT